jgi:hypothetical protein
MGARAVLGMKLVVVALVLTMGLAGCGQPLCGNELLSEARSPDGRYVAAVFERNCGATTPYVRIVSLRQAGDEFDSDQDSDWVLTTRNQPNVIAQWDGNAKLRVSSEGTKDGTRRSQWRDVAIAFDR